MNEPFYIRRGTLRNTRDAICGGKLTVGFLGGSISEPRCGERWTDKVVQWIASALPADVKLDVENAAFDATGSGLGAFKIERDILGRGCNLVFIEYAVNDGGWDPVQRYRSREGILRKLLRDGKTDVIITYTYERGMFETMVAGKLPGTIADFEVLAEHYGVSSVFMGSFALSQLLSGRIRYQEWLGDGLHPADMGSYIYAIPVIQFMEHELLSEAGTAILSGEQLPEPYDLLNWEEAYMLPFESIQRIGVWQLYRSHSMYCTDQILYSWSPGSRIRFTFDGRGFCIALDYGHYSADYKLKIDREDWKLGPQSRPAFIGDMARGWLRHDHHMLSEQCTCHEVELEVVLNNTEPFIKACDFRICFIGIVK